MTKHQGMNITIRKFDPSKMDDRRTVMLIGKRNTGKSVLAKDLMFYRRHIPVGMVMSGTEEGNGWYSTWVPDCFIYNDFDKGAVEKLIARQRRLAKLGQLQPAFLVLDDCMYDKKIMREKCIRQIYMNGRHWAIFCLTTAQYIADAGPEIRNNCDYVFVLRENIQQNRERLWRMFFGIFPTLDSFSAALEACTENYGCLVLDNTSKSNKLEDCVFWYKAKVRNDFRMGSPLLWHFHSRNYNPNYDEQDEAPHELGNRRKQLVSIQKLPARPTKRRAQ
jgi:hypothetical protein